MTAKLSIGLPVYNGENFIREALDSILDQTFTDFELVISDNASTDATLPICREYAQSDGRVRVLRNKENLGAGPNYRIVFRECSDTEYFKWLAHDDTYAPTYLEKCVSVLDRDASVVSCHCYTVSIDASGRRLKEWPARPALSARDPADRFRDVLDRPDCFVIWGVMRRETLARTPLLGDFTHHDRPLLAELALHGRIHEVPEFLFHDREHADRSIRTHHPSDPHHAAAWFDPRNRERLIFPLWRLWAEYLAVVRRVPLSLGARLKAHAILARWVVCNWRALLLDLGVAAERLPVVGPRVARLRSARLTRHWKRQTDHAVRELGRLARPGEHLIFVDQGLLAPDAFSRWKVSPLPEENGWFAGTPAGDDDAVAALENAIASGARYIVFFWPAFWWLDHYTLFTQQLQEHFRCVKRTERLMVFERTDRQPPRSKPASRSVA